MTPEELQAELERQQQAKIQSNAALEKQIAAGLERQKQPFVDLTPTAAFLDSLYGSKLAPASADMAANRLKEEALLNDLIGKKSAADADMFRAKVSGAQDRQAAINARQDKAYENSTAKEIRDSLNKLNKDIGQTMADLSGVDDALNSRDPEQINSKMSVIAKAINREAGALAEGDINRQQLQDASSLLVKYQNLFNRGNKLEPEDMQSLIATVSNARKHISDAHRQRVEAFKAGYEVDENDRRAFNRSRNIFNQTLGNIDKLGKSTIKEENIIKPKTAAKKSGGLSAAEQAEFDALNAKYGNKS